MVVNISSGNFCYVDFQANLNWKAFATHSNSFGQLISRVTWIFQTSVSFRSYIKEFNSKTKKTEGCIYLGWFMWPFNNVRHLVWFKFNSLVMQILNKWFLDQQMFWVNILWSPICWSTLFWLNCLTCLSSLRPGNKFSPTGHPVVPGQTLLQHALQMFSICQETP